MAGSSDRRVDNPAPSSADIPTKSKINRDLLPHAKVAALVKEYGLGLHRTPLSDLCIGIHNRGISWKYVNTLLHRLLTQEGFSAERYKYAIAIEPNLDDPMASNRRHMEEAEAAAGMLPNVDERPKKGLLTKNHLFRSLHLDLC